MMINDDFFDALKSGADLETACYAFGVPIQNLYLLMERGMHEDNRLGQNPRLKPKKSEEPALNVWRKISQAQAQAKLRVQTALHREIQQDWRGALGWLERRDFNNFGKVEERVKIAEIEKKMKELGNGDN